MLISLIDFFNFGGNLSRFNSVEFINIDKILETK